MMAKKKFKVVTNPLTEEFETVLADKYELQEGVFNFKVMDPETGSDLIVASFNKEYAPRILMLDE